MPTYKILVIKTENNKESSVTMYLRADTIAESDNLVRDLGNKVSKKIGHQFKLTPHSIMEEDCWVETKETINNFQ